MRPRSGRAFFTAPQIIVVEIFACRPFEGKHLAALRIHARHDVLDGSILARRIHRLEDQKHRLAILRVKHVLQFRERLDTVLQRLFRARFVRGLQFGGVARIKILEPKFLPVGDAIRLGNGVAASMTSLIFIKVRRVGIVVLQLEYFAPLCRRLQSSFLAI